MGFGHQVATNNSLRQVNRESPNPQPRSGSFDLSPARKRRVERKISQSRVAATFVLAAGVSPRARGKTLEPRSGGTPTRLPQLCRAIHSSSANTTMGISAMAT
jgi:hypothetical protein